MGMLDILNQYAGEPKAQSDTPAHFDEVASVASPGTRFQRERRRTALRASNLASGAVRLRR